jgi:hypothetical protein
MARSRRRTSRRTTSQRAAGLIALALPAPIQRVADTRFGSILMLVGVPAMIVFGLLNVTWQDGFPTFSLNRNKAAELQKVAQDRLNGLEHQAATEDWGQSVVGFLHAAQGPNHTHAPNFPSTSAQPTTAATSWQQQEQLRLQQQQYLSQQQAYQQQPTYQQQPQHSQQPTYQQPTYQQPYSQQQYSQQQYSQQQNTQQQPNPSSPYGQQQQPNPQWPGTAGFQFNPLTSPSNNSASIYGTTNYGSTAQPNGYANGYSPGYPPQNPSGGAPWPQTGNGNQNSYNNQNGQLGRY